MGLDSEWKPGFGKSQSPIALIQLATRDRIYLLDMVSLTPIFTGDVAENFINKVFANDNILKLGEFDYLLIICGKRNIGVA